MRRRLFNFAFAYFKIVFTFGLNRLHLFCFRCILLDHTSNDAETSCCYKDTHQRTDVVEETIWQIYCCRNIQDGGLRHTASIPWNEW